MTNKELIEYLRQYPPEAEITIIEVGQEDNGERWGTEAKESPCDPEEDLTYDSNKNTLFIGRW